MLKEITTSLEIKLVNVMRVLLVRFKDFNGLVYYGFETTKRYQRPTGKVFEVIPF